MNKELKNKWIEALRSGKYKQGRCTLRKENRFCCLGVLLDVIDPNEWGLRENGVGYYYGSIGSTGYIPKHIMENIGLGEEVMKVLVSYNDSGNFSFEQIADIIEKSV